MGLASALVRGLFRTGRILHPPYKISAFLGPAPGNLVQVRATSHGNTRAGATNPLGIYFVAEPCNTDWMYGQLLKYESGNSGG